MELEIRLTGGVRLQRQIVFAHDDCFVFLADHLTSPQRGHLEYRGVLPMAAQVEFRAARRAARAVSCFGRRPLAQAMPLGMPEWWAEQHRGELKATTEGLELREATAGQGLYVPMFIDLDRGRFRRRMTWRRLTVAESLTPVSPEVAAGFRVAVGAEQWLIYRALAARGNRTLLGHNLATESLIARFGKDGKVTSIVEIE